jgi:hypothetical protein
MKWGDLIGCNLRFRLINIFFSFSLRWQLVRTSDSLRERRASRRRRLIRSRERTGTTLKLRRSSRSNTSGRPSSTAPRDSVLASNSEIAKDYLKNRVLEVSLADLNNNMEDGFRKVFCIFLTSGQAANPGSCWENLLD